MKHCKLTTAMLGVLCAGFTPSMWADEINKETHVTINQPLQIQDTVLSSETHILQLLHPDVVIIYNADRTRTEGIVMGSSAYRLNADDKESFIVSESRRSQPATLHYWFYPGDNSGLEFSVNAPASQTVRLAKARKGSAIEPDTAPSATPK